jgi:hypothetical protein
MGHVVVDLEQLDDEISGVNKTRVVVYAVAKEILQAVFAAAAAVDSEVQ